jgi:hypothetical protein
MNEMILKLQAQINYKYPAGSTAAVYHDMDGKPVTLMQLVEREPQWAANRIITMDKLARESVAALEHLTTTNQSLMADKVELVHQHNSLMDHCQSLQDEIEALRGQVPVAWRYESGQKIKVWQVTVNEEIADYHRINGLKVEALYSRTVRPQPIHAEEVKP